MRKRSNQGDHEVCGLNHFVGKEENMGEQTDFGIQTLHISSYVYISILFGGGYHDLFSVFKKCLTFNYSLLVYRNTINFLHSDFASCYLAKLSISSSSF